MQQIQNAVPSVLALVCLSARPGHNPRKRFKTPSLDELASSIKARGVLQPLLVRPVGDNYEIVAGERRFRAAQMAGLSEVPVLVRSMSDEDAFLAAITENADRENPDPVDDAEAAAKALGFFAGDRDEAARRLGWTRQKLDKRLALMNCSDKVREALAEDKILLGHAELLATLAKDVQDMALGKMLGAAALPTVAELRSRVESLARSLESAPFDKSACAVCQHNSGQQRAMFHEAIGNDSSCTNAACYDGKVEAVLQAAADSLKDEYPTVRIVRSGENFTLLKVVAEGETGLGAEQAEACKACAKYGAAVSSVPGKASQIYRGLCFDPACNATKVAARIKAEKQAQPVKPVASPAGSKAASPAKPKAQGAAKPAETAQRVKDYRVKVWRDVLRRELMRDEERNLVALIAIGLSGFGRNISSSKLKAALEKLTGEKPEDLIFGFPSAAKMVMSLDAEKLRVMKLAVAASVSADIDETTLRSMLGWVQADLTAHWKIDAEFMGLLTKSEIDALAGEIGLKAHMGEKEFSKLTGGKKDEAIKKLLECGFEFQGKVPAVMLYASAKTED